MLPVFTPHNQFLTDLDSYIQSLDPSQSCRLEKYPEISSALQKVRMLNLDDVYETIKPLYSIAGPRARQQLEMFRSLVLMHHLGLTSIDLWQKKLAGDPLLFSLCGFKDKGPAVGSFYNLMDRLCNTEKTSNIQKPEFFAKPEPEKKPKKGEKLENVPKGKTEQLVLAAMAGMLPQDEYYTIHQLLKVSVTDKSILKGLIDADNLIVCGDGTAVHEKAVARGHHIEGDDKHRRYSDPDGRIGWDSDLGQYFFGYHGFFLACHNADKKVDLPLYLNLMPAHYHDSVSTIINLDGFRKLFTDLKIAGLCFDSASDNEATYYYAESFGAYPYIDINSRVAKNADGKKEYMNSDGQMICKGGIPMHKAGYDKTNNCTRYVCPMARKKSGVKECPLGEKCSKSKNGRTINYRPDTLRNKYRADHNEEFWKTGYNNRTSCERLNNRILNDYKLHTTRARGKNRLMFHTLMAGINIHLDAWIKCGV